jgi:predicted ATP-grasp superfamily ATP-dependent carboligase
MSVFLTNSTWKMTESAIRSFSSKNIRVVAGDTKIPSLNLYRNTEYVKYVSPLDNSFIDNLSVILDNKKSDVLFPMSNDAVSVISQNKNTLSGLTHIPIPDYSILEIAHDKLKTAHYAKKADICVPETHYFEDIHALLSSMDIFEYPLIVKPRFGGGASVCLHKVNSPDELVTAYLDVNEKYGPPIIQEYVPGGSEQMRLVDLICDKDSHMAAGMTAQKIREYPVNQGTMTYGISTYEPELLEISEQLLNNWGWYGAAEVEIKIDPIEEVPKLIEVNPRFWQHLQLSISCGLDLPHLLYQIALDEYVEYPCEYKVGVKYINPAKDILSISNNIRNLQLKNFTLELFDTFKGEKAYSIHDWARLDMLFRLR